MPLVPGFWAADPVIATLLLGLVALGLGGWLPAPVAGRVWPGLRLMSGFCLMMAVPYALHLTAGIGLTPAVQVTAVLGAAGLLRLLRQHGLPLSGALRLSLFHPLPVLALLVALLVAWRGLDYAPLAWDELSNWLAWTRLAVENDRLMGADISHGVPGYTPGWPLALAFPGLLAGGFEFNRAALVPLVMHLGLLGLLFDLARVLLERRGFDRQRSWLGAWLVLLILLGAEASWKLVPTNLLIEKPQIYLLTAWLGLAWLMLEEEGARAEAHLGVLFLGGYLVKVSMLAFAGPALVFVLWLAWRRRISPYRLVLFVFLPTLAAYAIWRVSGWQPGCMSEPMAVMRAVLAGGEETGRAIDLAGRLFGWIGTYLITYKPWLSAVSLLGLMGLAARPATRPLILAVLLYLALYFSALYAYHLSCFGEYYFQELNSPDRFTRVPLRVLHTLGLMALLLWLLPLLSGRRALMLVPLAVLALWQVRQTDGAVRALTSRWDASPEQVAIVSGMRAETGRIAAALAENPEAMGEIVLITQGDDGYRRLIVSFFAAGGFAPAYEHSWGEVSRNVWMTATDPARLRLRFLKARMIWPIEVDAWMIGVLRPLIEDGACLERLNEHYLIAGPAGRLACRAKP